VENDCLFMMLVLNAFNKMRCHPGNPEGIIRESPEILHQAEKWIPHLRGCAASCGMTVFLASASVHRKSEIAILTVTSYIAGFARKFTNTTVTPLVTTKRTPPGRAARSGEFELHNCTSVLPP